jgi:hypothetical protein
MRLDGLGAPDSVPAGSPGPIRVRGATSDQLTVTIVGTGESFSVDVDEDGEARVELPSGLDVGEVVIVADPDDLTRTATIEIVDATNF